MLLRATKNLLDQPEYQVSGLASLLVARSLSSPHSPPLNQPPLDQPYYLIPSHAFFLAGSRFILLATSKQLL